MQICASAVSSPRGIKLSVSDAKTFSSHFYSFRARQRRRGNLAFDELICHLVSPSEVWLIRESAQ